MPVARSSAFASFDAQPRSSEGINGALTPARPQRGLPNNNNNSATNPPAAAAPAAKSTNDIMMITGGQQQQHGGRVQSGGGLLFGSHNAASGGGGKIVSGGGISLQETEARIVELERSEFDLKLKLFYMEEQLELASGGGADVLQLHKETIDAKLVSEQQQ